MAAPTTGSEEKVLFQSSMADVITEYPQFFTATCLQWKKLLAPGKYKDIIIESLRFLVGNGRILHYGFVIMPNHLHLVWQMKAGHLPSDVQRDFLKFTAQQIKSDLQKNHPGVLEQFNVAAKDRTYQLWERNALSVDLWTEKTMLQKLTYIHQNRSGQNYVSGRKNTFILRRCFIIPGLITGAFLPIFVIKRLQEIGIRLAALS